MSKSGWPGWDRPQDRFAGYRATGPRWLFNAGHVKDADIDKALRSGKNPKRVFAKKLSQMAPDQRRKAERRIKARTDKRNQGK